MRRLIIRPGAIGDCILSLPAMEHLRAGYTEVWVARQNVPLVRFADCVRAIQSTGLDMVGLPGVEPPAATLRALERFDSIVSWYGAAREDFRAAVGQLPFTFLQALPDELRDAGAAADPRSSGGPVMHAADWFLRQAGGSGTAVPRIECPRHDGDGPRGHATGMQNGPGFAVIHPFSGSARKNWPLERFRALAERLPLPVQWCAGPEEALENPVRFDDLYELGRWLATARLYIGNDSGITHLAAAVGTPSVALFGPTDPRVWAPRGPCVTVIRGSGGSMESIAVEEVLARLPL